VPSWVPQGQHGSGASAVKTVDMSNAKFSLPGEHWDAVYAVREVDAVSWFQPHADMSVRLVEQLGVDQTTAVIDVGGGASMFVDDLIVRGFGDVTVLDISAAALAAGQARLAPVRGVDWLVEDLLSWHPGRRYGLWHDRAVLHFLTGEADRRRYVEVLRSATSVGSTVVLGVFAVDGPTSCSGLPVRRYAAEDLEELLGGGFTPVASLREEHVTPAGTVQPFTWLAARRDAD
jgi:hypothetical protein